MRSVRDNRCPICSVSIGAVHLMCRAHWFQVSKALRDRVWQLFQSAPGGDAHRAACFEAIQFVQQLQAKGDVIVASEKKQLGDLSDSEIDEILAKEVEAGMAEVIIENGVKKYRLSKKGMQYVEEKLLPQLGVPTGEQIIDQAKKGGR